MTADEIIKLAHETIPQQLVRMSIAEGYAMALRMVTDLFPIEDLKTIMIEEIEKLIEAGLIKKEDEKE